MMKAPKSTRLVKYIGERAKTLPAIARLACSGAHAKELLKSHDAIRTRRNLDFNRRQNKPPGAYCINIPHAVYEYFPPLSFRSEYHMKGSVAGNTFIRQAWAALSLSTQECGYHLNATNDVSADCVLNWSNKSRVGSAENRLYLEHGWLPRSSYQISKQGTNALSHVAKSFKNKSCEDINEPCLDVCLKNLKRLSMLSVRREVVEHVRQSIGQPFVLFALQLANDANLQYSNNALSGYYYTSRFEGNRSFLQACIDLASPGTSECHLVFKQHPMDDTDANSLMIPDKVSFIENKQDIRLQEFFASGMCKAVVSVNSNSLHEALVWEIPGIALGTLMWEEGVGTRPFPKSMNSLADVLTQGGIAPAQRVYLQHLLENQWFVSDLANPLMVQKLIESEGECVPALIRNECRYII